MKITNVRTEILSVPMPKPWVYGLGSTSRKDELIVIVETDAGIEGIGVSYHGHAARSIRAVVDGELRPRLIGADPLGIQENWDRLFASTFYLGAACAMALAGIDIALWDILGKVANLPVRTILGGGGVSVLPLYVGCMTLGIQEPESLLAEASVYVEAGYRALKVRGGAGVRHDETAVRVVRESFPDINIMVDANSAYSYGEAVDLGRRLAKLEVTWLEDPFDYTVAYHPQQMGQLSRDSDTPICSGGGIYTRFDLKKLLDSGGCQYITPDVVKCGISEALKMAAIASSEGILVAPHTVAGIAGVANSHYAAAIPANARSYLEWDPTSNPLQTNLYRPAAVVSDGMLVLADRPGLGIELNQSMLSQYPHIAEQGVSGGARGEAERIRNRYRHAATS